MGSDALVGRVMSLLFRTPASAGVSVDSASGHARILAGAFTNAM